MKVRARVFITNVPAEKTGRRIVRNARLMGNVWRRFYWESVEIKYTRAQINCKKKKKMTPRAGRQQTSFNGALVGARANKNNSKKSFPL